MQSQTQRPMGKNNHPTENEGMERFIENLSSSPEWASLRIRKKSSILYILTILAGIGLCVCTLSVLLS